MDLRIGKHCSVETCNVNDLLPIQCPRCDAPFCRDHISLDRHACPKSTSPPAEPASLEWVKRDICEVDGCSKSSLASALDPNSKVGTAAAVLSSALCPRCSGAYCVIHRFPENHECSQKLAQNASSLPPTPEPGSKAAQVEAAKSILARNFPSTSKSTPNPGDPTNTKPKPKANKKPKSNAVELIKMRHKAIPGDAKDKNVSVPLERRLHLFVRYETSEPVLLWFRKELVGGRVLDMLDIRFSSTKTPTKLVTIADDGSERDIQLDRPLSEQATDGMSLVVRKRE